MVAKVKKMISEMKALRSSEFKYKILGFKFKAYFSPRWEVINPKIMDYLKDQGLSDITIEEIQPRYIQVKIIGEYREDLIAERAFKDIRLFYKVNNSDGIRVKNGFSPSVLEAHNLNYPDVYFGDENLEMRFFHMNQNFTFEEGLDVSLGFMENKLSIRNIFTEEFYLEELIHYLSELKLSKDLPDHLSLKLDETSSSYKTLVFDQYDFHKVGNIVRVKSEIFNLSIQIFPMICRG